MDHDAHQRNIVYQLGLVLLELIDRPVAIELELADELAGLALHGTLLRAFDPPTTTDAPTIAIMVGAHCVNIRLAEIKRIAYNRTPDRNQSLLGVHLLLADGYAIHIKPQPPDR